MRLLSRSSARAGIGHLSAHDLRRTHITLALDRGAPLQDMQAQAGHANPSTTLRYAQPSDAKDRRATDRFLSSKLRQRTIPLRALIKGDYTADILGVNGMSTDDFADIICEQLG